MATRVVLLAAAVCLIVSAIGVPAAAQPRLGDPDYRLKKGDTVRIVVPDRPTLSRDLIVNESGAVFFPLTGDIAIEGLTTAEAHEKIFLTLNDYYPSLARDDFTVEAVASVVVYVSGEVATPGRYIFANPPSLWEAIREAGGPTAGAALDIVRVVRGQGSESVTETVNVLSAIEQSRTDELPKLNDGDTVVLLSSRDTYVGEFGVNLVGAVAKPGFYRIQGEHKDVMSAVMLAGGFLPKAAIGGVKVIRTSEDGSTVTEELRLDQYMKKGDPALNPVLYPGDTVVVPEQNSWAYQFKTNFGIILSLIATTATVILVIDRINNP
jgi:protein involved in polysaccharide export with SLBB domain